MNRNKKPINSERSRTWVICQFKPWQLCCTAVGLQKSCLRGFRNIAFCIASYRPIVNCVLHAFCHALVNGNQSVRWRSLWFIRLSIIDRTHVTDFPFFSVTSNNKKLSYRRVTARCVLSVVILPITTQQCMQKLLTQQVLTKPMVWSWRFSWRQCVINKPTTVELCISPVYRRLAVAKFSKSTM